MPTVVLLAIAAVTLVLDFIIDFQKPDGPNFLPIWLRSPRSHLWLRTTVLGLAFIGLGMNQFQLRDEKLAAERSASDLRQRLTSVQSENAKLADQNTAIKSVADSVHTILRRIAVYGKSRLSIPVHTALSPLAKWR
jgi:hypothetical protein